MTRTKTGWYRYSDKVLDYHYDLFNRKRLLRIRLIKEDGKNNILTPVTPTYENAFVDVRSRSVAKREPELEPRHLEACFEIQEGIVTRTIYNPYVPTNANHRKLIRELIAYEEVKSVQYKGEVYNSRYEDLTDGTNNSQEKILV